MQCSKYTRYIYLRTYNFLMEYKNNITLSAAKLYITLQKDFFGFFLFFSLKNIIQRQKKYQSYKAKSKQASNTQIFILSKPKPKPTLFFFSSFLNDIFFLSLFSCNGNEKFCWTRTIFFSPCILVLVFSRHILWLKDDKTFKLFFFFHFLSALVNIEDLYYINRNFVTQDKKYI